MNLHLSRMPDEPVARIAWLERRLVSADLAELVGELAAVHGSSERTVSLEDVLGPHQQQVLRHGLAALPVERLLTLLQQPQLLFGLQEYLLTASGSYWETLLDGSRNPWEVARGEKRLRTALELTRPPRSLRTWLVALATAAVVMGVFVWAEWMWTPRPWGWNRPEILDAAPTVEYLSRLADAAEEWRQQPRDDAASLVKSLRELRDGCTRLLAAEHGSLSLAERSWLLEKCRAWGTKMDQHLAELAGGTKDWQVVRHEADETVDKLTRALKQGPPRI
jgi:hypothetical protein